MKYISIDIETTGLEFSNCQILEFGAVIDDLKKPDVDISDLPKFRAVILGEDNIISGHPVALQMNAELIKEINECFLANTTEKIYNNRKKYEELFNITTLYTAPAGFSAHFRAFIYENIEQQHRKYGAVLAGKNAGGFDVPFCKSFFPGFKDIELNHKILDPLMLFLRRSDDCPPGLPDCLRRSGIEKVVAHTSIEDAIDVIQVIRYGMKDKE